MPPFTGEDPARPTEALKPMAEAATAALESLFASRPRALGPLQPRAVR